MGVLRKVLGMPKKQKKLIEWKVYRLKGSALSAAFSSCAYTIPMNAAGATLIPNC
jgi:hypothetical protein